MGWRDQFGWPTLRSDGLLSLPPRHLPCIYLPLITVSAERKKNAGKGGKQEDNVTE